MAIGFDEILHGVEQGLGDVIQESIEKKRVPFYIVGIFVCFILLLSLLLFMIVLSTTFAYALGNRIL